MKRILFVCLGNICRSPLAEGIMLHLIAKKQLDLAVDSAGTAGYHIGEAPDRRTINNARRHGVDLSLLRARQFKVEDFDAFDLILAMDSNNLRNLQQMAQGAMHLKKTQLLLEYAGSNTTHEVPDPYYGSEKDFEEVFQLVYLACEQLCEKLKQ